MVMPVQTVSRQTVAQSATFDGRQVFVNKVNFSVNVPGIGTEGFAVDVGRNNEKAAFTIGFKDYQEAINYLTSIESEEYTVFDAVGNASKESRVGLGIPEAMIVETKSAPSQVAVAVAAPVPPNAAQYPQTAAAMNAPSDAADLPHGNMTGEGEQHGNTENVRPEGTPTVGNVEVTTTTEKPKSNKRS